jgi:hypothetical protein
MGDPRKMGLSFLKKRDYIYITDGELRISDKIKFKGTMTDFEQEVESMQAKHENLEKVEAGADIGTKVKGRVREHDAVYVVR